METRTKKRKQMSRQEVESELRNLIPQKEAARLMRVTPKTLMCWNRVGYKGRTLAKVRVGRHVYYRPEDLSQFKQLISGGK